MTARNGASRRQMLKVAGASASGAALVAVLGRSRTASRRAQVPAPTQNAVAENEAKSFLSDLAGAKLGPYRVESVGSIDRGGVPVIMTTAKGDTFRVDVLRTDPHGTSGIGVASLVSVYLRNGGDGATATDEERGLGAMALAAELARRGKNGEQPPAALLTMVERAALDAVT